jgi:hypothetical protein
VIRAADPADKAEIYTQLGLRLTYQPGDDPLFEPRSVSCLLSISNSKVSEGGPTPYPHIAP